MLKFIIGAVLGAALIFGIYHETQVRAAYHKTEKVVNAVQTAVQEK